MKKKIDRFLILDKLYIVVIILIAIGIFFYISKESEYIPFSDFYVVSADAKVGMQEFEQIKTFVAENGKNYLFLPSHFKNEKCKLGLYGTPYVYVDGKKVKEYSAFTLKEGEHVLTSEEGHEIPFTCFYSANAGTVSLTTQSGTMEYLEADKNNREDGQILVLDKKGEIQYEGELERINGRSNTNWYMTDKKSFLLTLPEKNNLFGMGKSRKWVLVPNSFDETLLKNYMVYNLAEDIGIKFQPQCEFVDVYMNGIYWGNYLIAEKVEIGKNRIDIHNLSKETKELNELTLDSYPAIEEKIESNVSIPGSKKYFEIPNIPKDLTGGYLLEMELDERYIYEEYSGFVSDRKQSIVCAEPEYVSKEQVDYISNVYQLAEDAAFSADGINPKTGKHFYEYLDMDSFIKKYLIEEITKNDDCDKSSFYMYKYPDSVSKLLYAGPVWDYDYSLGAHREKEGYDVGDPVGLLASVNVYGSNIMSALYEKDEFYKAMVKEYKGKVRKEVLDWTNRKIPQKAIQLQNAKYMDSVRWNIYETDDRDEIMSNYQKEVDWLIEFLTKRIEFLDEEWGIK